MAKGINNKPKIGRKRPVIKTIVKVKNTKNKTQMAKQVVGRSAMQVDMSHAAHPFDPTTHHVPPSLLSIPRVFPITGTARAIWDTALIERTLFFISGWGGGGSIAYRVTYNTDANTVSSEAYTVPLMALSSSTGGPTSSKISKVGFRCVNSTPALNRGGRAYLCRLDQRIKFAAAPSSMNAAAWSAIKNTLINLPDDITRPIDLLSFGSNGKDGQKPQICIVDDEVDYNVFENHIGVTTGLDEWFSHVGVWAGAGMSELQRPMSTLVMVLEPPAGTGTAQQLTLNFDAQWLTRWPVDTVPGQAAGTIPASPHSVVDFARREAEKIR